MFYDPVPALPHASAVRRLPQTRRIPEGWVASGGLDPLLAAGRWRRFAVCSIQPPPATELSCGSDQRSGGVIGLIGRCFGAEDVF